MDLNALKVHIAERTATVTVTLPIPSDKIRAVIKRDVKYAIQDIGGIRTVKCQFEPRVPDPEARVDFIPEVKNVVAVASGKGGVGKSTIAVNLAVALADAGATVGLLDADVYGPNAPTMLGLERRTPNATRDDQMVPREAHGVQVMSMDFIVGEDDPVIWRGPLVDEFIKQLFGDVEWGALDYLIVDLPPGTGDAQLSLVQHLPVTGAVVVTTPEAVSVDDAHRGLRGFAQYNTPILGVAENMASFECPDCGSEHDIFDAGGAEQLAREFNVPVLGQLPIDPAVGKLDSENGTAEPPGISIPGIGRLQLPQRQDARERPTSLPPIAVRDEGGTTRDAVELLATRTAARINHLIVGQEGSGGDRDN
ncbi:ATP-binding protein [halophilic archaeon]|nr:ATP-binding protein [halophilic archaeon]